MSRNDSKLLIDEHPLQVLPTLAVLIGLNEAIILQQIHYWTGIARKSKNERNFKDGRWWVYNTYKEWKENFPWWSLDTIRRAIGRLEEKKLLISIEMNAQDWDHTKWYSIDYDALNALTDMCKMHTSSDEECPDRYEQDAQILIESETTTETTQKTTSGGCARPPSPRLLLRQELQGYFVSVTGLPPPKAKTKADMRAAQKLWWGPLDYIGNDLAGGRCEAAKDLIRMSVLRLKDVTVASPNSILNTAKAIFAERNRSVPNNGYTPA